MKKIVALALLVFMICTPMCAINVHGAEDPCGKGCPLIERCDFERLPGEEFIWVIYLYDCGNRVEIYTEDGLLEQCAIYDYSKDFIRQYVRQGDGSLEYSLWHVPETQVIVAPTTEK